MKKIISISLWGNDKRHIDPLLKNVEMLPLLLSEWSFRVYYDLSIPSTIFAELSTSCEMIECKDNIEFSGLFWRYAPFWDDTVERFFVTDSEIPVTERFAGLLLMWEKTDYKFYLQRLIESDCGTVIRGGRMGAVPNCIPGIKDTMDEFIKNWKPIVSSRRGYWYGADQIFLKRHVWPVIKYNHLAHIIDNKYLKLTGKEVVVN
jgi:hypothetical protein